MLSNKQNKIINMLLDDSIRSTDYLQSNNITNILEKYKITIADVEDYLLENIEKYKKFDLLSFAIHNQSFRIMSYLLKDENKSYLKRKINNFLTKDHTIFQFTNSNMQIFLFNIGKKNFNADFFDLLMEYNLLSIKSEENLLYDFAKIKNLKLIKMINVGKVNRKETIEDKIVYNAIEFDNIEVLEYVINIFFKYNQNITDTNILDHYLYFLLETKTQETFDCIVNIRHIANP